MNRICKVILAAAAVALMAGAAFATPIDKLKVRNVGDTDNVFRVDAAGLTEAKGEWSPSDYTTTNPDNGLVLARQPVLGVYNSGILRMNVTPSGITEWLLRSATAESGKIAYSTPGGGTGILFYTGPTYDQNRFDFANYPTLGTGGTPVAHFGYTGSPLALAITKTNSMVGIGTVTPTSKLHVIGLPVYANNAAAISGGMTAGAFYRTGADPDHICVVH